MPQTWITTGGTRGLTGGCAGGLAGGKGASGTEAAAATGATHATAAAPDVAAAHNTFVPAAAGQATDCLCIKMENIARRAPFQGPDAGWNTEKNGDDGSTGFTRDTSRTHHDSFHLCHRRRYRRGLRLSSRKQWRITSVNYSP